MYLIEKWYELDEYRHVKCIHSGNEITGTDSTYNQEDGKLFLTDLRDKDRGEV